MNPVILRDRFGRRIEYLRLSVTDRCDLRCSYCLPGRFNEFADPDEWLNFDEIERLVALFARFREKPREVLRFMAQIGG